MHLFYIYRRSSYGKIWNKTAKRSIQMDWRSVPQIPTLLMTTKIESGALHARHVLREWSLHQHVVPHWFAQQLAIAYHARQVPTQRKPIAQRVKPALTVAQKRSWVRVLQKPTQSAGSVPLCNMRMRRPTLVNLALFAAKKILLHKRIVLTQGHALEIVLSRHQ